MKGKFLFRVVDFFKGFHGVMFGVFAFIMFLEGVGIFIPVLTGKIVDSLNHKALTMVAAFALMEVGLSFTQKITWFFRNWFELNHFDYETNRSAAWKTLHKFLSLSVGQHSNQHSGLSQSITEDGRNAIVQYVKTVFYQVVPEILRLIFVSGYLLWRSPVLGAIVAVGAAVFIPLNFYANARIKDELKVFRDADEENSRKYSEIVQNASMIQHNAQEARTIGEYDEDMRKFGEQGAALWHKYDRFAVFVRDMVPIFIQLSLTLVGAYLVFKGVYTTGYLVTVFGLSQSAMGRLGVMAGMQRQLLQQKNKIIKYFELLDQEPDIKVIPNSLRPETYGGFVELKGVTYAYPVRAASRSKLAPEKSKPVLKGVSLRVYPGQTVALVGKNGSGKSSLLELIARSSDPDEGQVLVDGNDLRLLDLKHYRQHCLGYVQQEVRLLDDTLRKNILFSLNGASSAVTEEDLKNIIELSRISSFFPTLEHGFDTLVGERGVKLSGGQRKMVGIARAAIKKPPILLFDEATSGLDQEEESLLYDSLNRVSKGRTTLMVTHRLSTLQGVDNIFFLRQGKLVGEGTYDELMRTCVPFRDLAGHSIAHF